MFMYKLKSDKRGMTLIEMIISLVILSILMTSTLGMISSSMSIFSSTSVAAMDRMVGNSVFSTLQSTLKYATKITLSTDPIPESTSQAFYINAPADQDSGKLMYRRDGESYASLYDESFYKGRTVQYSIHQAGKLGQTGADSRHLRIEVKIFRDGKVVYTKNSIIKCINLDLVSSSGNVLMDNTSPSSKNQFIYFSNKELLVAGGEVAWSTEFKINEYMNRYNDILEEYFYNFNKANKKLNDIRVGNADEEGSRAQIDTLNSAISARDIAIFGIKGDNSGRKAHAGKNPDEFYNLRGYYQAKIKDLLKFTPNKARLPDNNPFSGVVATKEELYTGFMLTYFDKNHNGRITKDEYPSFAGDDFFEGTVLKNYDGSNNGMKIMCYFESNIKELKYVCSEETIPIFVYSKVGDVPSSRPVSNFPEYSNQVKGEGVEGAASVPQSVIDYNNWSGNDAVARAQLFRSFRFKKKTDTAKIHEIVYGKKKTKYKENPNVIGNYAEYKATTRWFDFLHLTGYADMPKDDFGNDARMVNRLCPEIANRLGAECLPYEVEKGRDDKLSYKKGIAEISPLICLRITAPHDLYEGWYYCEQMAMEQVLAPELGAKNEPVSNYYFFYLAGDSDFPDKKMEDVGLISNGKKVAVKSGDKIRLYYCGGDGDNYASQFYTYDQATVGTAEQTLEPVDVTFYKANQHKYLDFMLYAADWNSWFKTTQSGLLNELIGNIANIFTNQSDITEISGKNADMALGLKGKYNINGIDTQVRSYNMFWMIYDTHRGAWYYLPANSNAINSAWSGITWTSQKNSPTPLNLDSWHYSSTSVNRSIERMTVPKDYMFGLISSEKDARWVSLPAGNKIDRNTILDKNPIV